jgi:putative sterol carrier protein
MPPLLSEEWIEGAAAIGAALPPSPGVNLTFDVEVSDGPDGKVRCHAVFEEGRVVTLAAGKAEASDITLKCTYADALALVGGDLNPAAGFMRGQIKVDGSYTLLIFGFARKLSHETLQQLSTGLRELTEPS